MDFLTNIFYSSKPVDCLLKNATEVEVWIRLFTKNYVTKIKTTVDFVFLQNVLGKSIVWWGYFLKLSVDIEENISRILYVIGHI